MLSHLPEAVERLLGDGTRWGSQFTHHLARDPAQPYRVFRSLDWLENSPAPLLWVRGDCLPDVCLNEVPRTEAPAVPLLFCLGGDRSRDWSGWAVVSGAHIAAIPPDLEAEKIEAFFRESLHAEPAPGNVDRLIDFRTGPAILQSMHALFATHFAGLMMTAREVEVGVWLARNVMLHPTAQIVPPVYVGEDSSVGRGVRLGPNATVGRRCVLDSQCTVADSVVLPGSYVGHGLELADVLVDRNLLVNTRVGGSIIVTDNFILGSLAERHLRRTLMRLVGRSAATLLLILTSPVLLATMLYLKLFRAGPVVWRRDVLALPAHPDKGTWRTFALWSFAADTAPPMAPGPKDVLLRFLPALVNVARGQLSFVGVAPRSPDEVAELPSDWRSLYLRAKAGIVQEALIQGGPAAPLDEIYAAEAWYVATAGWGRDCTLLLRYVFQVIRGKSA